MALTTGTPREVGLLLSVHPQSVPISTARVTQILDTPVGKTEIARYNTAINLETAVGLVSGVSWKMDTKAMRKLSENDEIVISHIAIANNEFELHGYVYLWFKE